MSWVKEAKLKQIINMLGKNMAEAQRKYERKLKGKWMSVIIANMWKRSKRRWGPSIEIINQNQIRRVFTFQTLMLKDKQNKRCLEILHPFLVDNIKIILIKNSIKKFYKLIEFIQKRLRDKLVSRGNKVEVLMNYWDKLYGQMQMKASATKDVEANKLLT